MQNKVLVEGVITNKPTLSKFNSTMLFLKQSFKKNDGTESTTRFRCDAKGAIAEEICNNYTQNQLVQLTGMLRDSKCKKKNEEGTWVELMDQFGDQVWEKTIFITAIKKLGEAAMTVRPAAPAPQRQPTPIFKKNNNPPQPVYVPQPEGLLENYDDELPF